MISARCRRNLQRHDFVTTLSSACRPAYGVVATLSGRLPAPEASQPAMKSTNPPTTPGPTSVQHRHVGPQRLARPAGASSPRTGRGPRRRVRPGDTGRRHVYTGGSGNARPQRSRRRRAPSGAGRPGSLHAGTLPVGPVGRRPAPGCKKLAYSCQVPAQAYGLLSGAVDTVEPQPRVRVRAYPLADTG